MAAAKPPKALLISQWLEQLKTAFPNTPELPRLDFVESVIFAILRENRSSSEALATLTRFKTDYENDFNELRVSGSREIAQKIGPLPDAESRARTIRKFLHDIFDKNYKFQIDGLNKKPFKEIRDELKDYQALGMDHHIAIVQVQCLGGHAFPVDARLLEAGKRLGFVDRSTDAATLRGLLEKNIPKAQILHAIALAERFVNEICTHDAPRCKDCIFQKICPYYLELTQPAKPQAAEKPKAKAAATNVKTAPAPAATPKPVKAAPAPAPKPAPAKPAPAKPTLAKSAANKPAAEKTEPVKAATRPAPAPAPKAAAKPAAKPVPATPASKKPAEVAPAAAPAKKPKPTVATKVVVAPPKEPAPPKPAKPAPKPAAKSIAPAAKAKPAKPAAKKPADKPPAAAPKKRKS